MYTGPNQTGTSVTYTGAGNYPYTPYFSNGWNDATVSINLVSGSVVLWQNDIGSGSSVSLSTPGTYNLSTYSFANQLSSFVLSGGSSNGGSLSMNTGAGNISVSGAVGATHALAALSLTSTGTTTFSAAVTAASVVQNASSGTTAINGGAITTSGAQTFGNNVTLGADTTLNSNSGGSANGAVSFSGTLNSVSTTPYALTITSGSGNETFTGIVGGTNKLAALSLTSTGTTTFSAAVTAASVVQNASSGTTAINGATITTSGVQTFGNNVTLGADTTLTATSGGTNNAITITGTLNSASSTPYNLTTYSGTAGTTFTGAVGATNKLAALAVNSTGATIFSSTVAANSVTTDTGGTVSLGGNVTTSGNQSYGEAATLAASITLATTSNGTVSFALSLIHISEPTRPY